LRIPNNKTGKRQDEITLMKKTETKRKRAKKWATIYSKKRF